MNQNTISEFTGHNIDVNQAAPPTAEERIDELASDFRGLASILTRMSAKLDDINEQIRVNKTENQVQHTVIKNRITEVQDNLNDRITELSITVDHNEANRLIDVEKDRKHMKAICADTDANLRALENRIIINDEERVQSGRNRERWLRG